MTRIFQVGDTVKVKEGTIDPDFGFEIDGWHGQITEIDDDLVCIELDSISLSETPDKYFTKCEIDDLDWKMIYLRLDEVELSERRDTEEDLAIVRKQIQLNHEWDDLGDSGKIVSEVLKNIDPSDDSAAFNAWENYLNENLTFPLKAEISEYQDNGFFEPGDEIGVDSIIGNDESDGVIAKVIFETESYYSPIYDIQVLDEESKNSKVLAAYRAWFENR
jgi:hypothetical protein